MKFKPDQKYIDDGLIAVQESGDGLRLYNYTQKCQFSRAWDSVTIQARGIVVDENDEVVALPFPKFFNWEEYDNEGFPFQRPPWPPEAIEEKLDGSLGILYLHRGKLRMNTRGSFKSEQALKAMEILTDIQGHMFDRLERYMNQFSFPATHLFEIIYPQNRIVVDYGPVERLVYLGSLNPATGADFKDTFLTAAFGRPIVYDDVPKEALDLKTIGDIKNREGYVLRYSDGTRIKIKLDEYKRLHKLITGVTEKTIWELLVKNEGLGEIIERVPDEFHAWINSVALGLTHQMVDIKHDTTAFFHDTLRTLEDPDPERERERKKAFALAVKGHSHADILFALYGGQKVEPLIWRKLKPRGNRPFKIDE